MKKNVLISGAMNKSGMAIAKAFRKEGFYVYGLDKKEDYESICDRSFRFNLEEFVSNADYRIRFTQIFDEIIPNLNVLVNNEEVVFEGRLNEVQLEQWQQSINVNLTGPMMLCKFFLNRLEKSKGSIVNIINLSSQKEIEGGISYYTSRMALLQLTKAMAIDLKEKVRVNSICFDPYRKNQRGVHGEIKEEKLSNEIGRLSAILSMEEVGYLSGENINLG
ncbi:MAG: SDR family oxidoreductase [Saprospiraceae bacterium]